jgi:hypothetical protein
MNGSAGLSRRKKPKQELAGSNGAVQPQRRKAETLLLAWLSASLRHVRFGSLADITACSSHVRFTPESGHAERQHRRPLSANSRHSAYGLPKGLTSLKFYGVEFLRILWYDDLAPQTEERNK